MIFSVLDKIKLGRIEMPRLTPFLWLWTLLGQLHNCIYIHTKVIHHSVIAISWNLKCLDLSSFVVIAGTHIYE